MTEKQNLSTTNPLAEDRSKSTLAEVGWQAANFSATVSITSGLMALVHNPLNAMMMCHQESGRLIPPASRTSNGLLLVVRYLYTGFMPCLWSTGSRTVYMSGAKKADQERRENHEEAPLEQQTNTGRSSTNTVERIGFIAAMSIGELTVTQVPEALSQMRKCALIQQDFKWHTWHNFKKLSITSAGARLGFGFVNFLALCEAEQWYANQLPIQNDTTKHFWAGALGGATAAILSYPFSNYRDYHLSQIRVNNGKIISPGAQKLFSKYYAHIQAIGIKAGAKQALNNFCIQGPLRIARTSTRFGLIAGVAEWFQNEPLSHVVKKETFTSALNNLSGFFPPSEPSAQIKKVKPPRP